MRYSHQRQLVYDALCSTLSHPDAAWVYAKVKESLPNVSLGTVYRNLGELCDAGIVKRISAVGSIERYDATTKEHPHFVCKSCGKITDLPPDKLSVSCLLSDVEEIEIMTYGTCSDCKTTGGKENG